MTKICSNVKQLGDVRALPKLAGPQWKPMPLMPETLCTHLREHPYLWLDEVATIFRQNWLLHHCGRWPAPKSDLVMDNASFHHSERVKQMCWDAGVKLVYLPPYSPDLNLIEELFFFFCRAQGFHLAKLATLCGQPCSRFPRLPTTVVYRHCGWCKQSTVGNFRHAGLKIDGI